MPINKTHKTAVVIIPPKELWPGIQFYRAKYDRGYKRWMPHITLLYPFKPVDHHDQLKSKFLDQLASFRPFQISLSQASYFTDAQNATFWLQPEPALPLIYLQHKLQSIVPECDDVNKFGRVFTPHLTLGQLDASIDPDAFCQQINKQLQPIRFQTNSIHFIFRNNPPDDQFKINVTLPFGGM